MKMKVKINSVDVKCKKLLQGIRTARSDLEGEASEVVFGQLRRHILAEGLKAEAFFYKLSDGSEEVSMKSLKEYIEKIPDLQVKAGQLDLALRRYTAGFRKLSFLEISQEYRKCVHEIAITSALEVKDGKTLRKLTVGEVLEVLEVGKVDAATSLPRLRCRALSDNIEGWAAFKGNQGTSFLERCSKPYFRCLAESGFQKSFESCSAEVKKLALGEVVEVLEGPRKEIPDEALRLKVKSSKDGKTGFVTLKDSSGQSTVELAKLMVCKQSIALTTTFDIAAGKAIRKLEAGEVLEVLEGPNEDSVRSLSRVRAVAKKDGGEGWVTVKGNQGTAYAEFSDKHYVCKSDTPLENRLVSGSPLIRTLETGEALEALEEPKSEKKDSVIRIHGKSLADASEGWFNLSSKTFQYWSPLHKVAASTALNETLEAKEEKPLRELEVGEIVEAIALPALQEDSGLVQVRVRAEKDGLVGYASLQNKQGTMFLKPIVDESTTFQTASARPPLPKKQ